jgi:hypothetical protein
MEEGAGLWISNAIAAERLTCVAHTHHVKYFSIIHVASVLHFLVDRHRPVVKGRAFQIFHYMADDQFPTRENKLYRSGQKKPNNLYQESIRSRIRRNKG